jgi:hypothetical protein|tara:strand:+ start:483 stop:1868 length:1386 start_codon:yes stop_codon:yes gene_type:complete
MAVILNAKGTSQSNFRIGKRGSRIHGTSNAPSDVSTISTGDLWFDSSNTLLKIATVSGDSVAWNLLDAGTVDGVDSTSFARKDQAETFANDITITGNLTVNGTQSIINTETLNIADNEIVLNSDLASNQQATANAGILVNRGAESNVYIRWDEDEGEWTVNGDTFSAGTFIGNLSGTVTGSIQPNGAANTVKANTLIVTGASSSAKFGDNNKLNIGTGDDLQIYHDGSNSYIDDAGTGSIKLRSGTFTISNLAGSKTSALFSSGGAQTFYHDNSTKLETSATGITVTGTVDVNGAYTLPTTDGSADQVLTTDGSGGVTFTTPSVSAGGSNTHVQYNDEGVLGGSGTFTYDEAEAKLTVGGSVSSILFETVSDYGAITTTATDSVDYGTLTGTVVALVNSDYGVVESSGGPVEFPRYTVSGVPDASAYIGHMVYVSNETGGPVMAFSDGTNWRRVTDRAVIS